MARDKNGLCVTVPRIFRCPISMDVMKSPVSLCTGVTYDRSSIKTWLDSGHNICPATMQVLQSTDIVPNLTLRRLIRCWSDSLLPPDSPAASHLPRTIPSIDSKQQVVESIKNVINNKSELYLISLSNILEFANYSDENREFLPNYEGFVPAIVEILSRTVEIEVMETIITVLDLIKSESRVKEQLHELMFRNNRDCLSSFLFVLQKGKLNSKINSAKILESISSNPEAQRAITEKHGLLAELYNLISSETHRNAVVAGLSALIVVSQSRQVKTELVRLGIVRTGEKILSESGLRNGPVIEKVMKVLEMVSTCTEGRAAICEDERCVKAIVTKLMKVSGTATEHGIGVLWSVCYLSRDRTAREAVMKSNGLMKLLLVMQSNCSSGVRQMCSDLVKVFRVNSKSLLASYEARTTHITPY